MGNSGVATKCAVDVVQQLFYLFKYFASYLYKLTYINYVAFLLMKQGSSAISERGGVDSGGSIGQRGGVDSGGGIGQRGGSSYHGSLD